MCCNNNKKWCLIISGIISLILAGIFTCIAHVCCLVNPVSGFASFFGIFFGLLLLVILAITTSSLLRQDNQMNACICFGGKILLICIILLLLFSSIVAFLTSLCIPVPVWLLFLTIFWDLFTLASVFCFFYCLTDVGCQDHCG